MKRCVIYGRVSTNQQDTSSQIEVLKKYAIDKGYIFDEKNDVFEEKVSAVKKGAVKIQLEKMIEYAIINKCDTVLVWELSRISRLLKDFVSVVDRLIDNRINLYVYNGGISLLLPNGEVDKTAYMVLSIFASIGHNEAQTIKERSSRGLLNSALTLNHFGGITPYGYDRQNKKLVINKEEAEIVRRIFDYSKQNIGSRKIARTLNLEGIKTKYTKIFNNDRVIEYKSGFNKVAEDYIWNDGTIYSILRNPIYKGIRMFKDNAIEIPDLRIIDDDIFKIVNDRLTEHSSKKGTHTKFTYLLNNQKIKCGDCGRNYHIRRTKDLKSNNYICYTKRTDNRHICKSDTIQIPKLENVCWYVVRRTDTLKKIIEKSINESDVVIEIKKVKDRIEHININLNSIIRKENNLLDLYQDGMISKDIYVKRFELIKTDKNKVENELEYLSSKLIDLENFEQSQNNLNTILKNIKLDPHTMQEYINQIVKSITIYPVLNDNYHLLGSHKQDRTLYIELYLFTSLTPVKVLVSQRTNNIVILKEGEYSTKKMMVVNPRIEINRVVEMPKWR